MSSVWERVFALMQTNREDEANAVILEHRNEIEATNGLCYRGTFLNMAQSFRSQKLTRTLLSFDKIDVNRNWGNKPAIFDACEYRSYETFAILLDDPRVDIRITGKGGWFIIYVDLMCYIIYHGDVSCFKMLLASWKEPEYLLKLVNENLRYGCGNKYIFELMKSYSNVPKKVRSELRRELNYHYKDAAHIFALLRIIQTKILQIKA